MIVLWRGSTDICFFDETKNNLFFFEVNNLLLYHEI